MSPAESGRASLFRISRQSACSRWGQTIASGTPGDAGIVRGSIAQSTQYTTIGTRFVDSRFGAGRTVARIIGRILLTQVLLAVIGFVLLVLIGVWDRYERKTAASDFGLIPVGDLASQARLSRDPKDRATGEAERAQPAGVGQEQTAPAQFFPQVSKLVGTSAPGSTSQGMSVALSADGNTAVVGGPGPNDALHLFDRFVTEIATAAAA